MKSIFFYGTLCIPEVFFLVIKKQLKPFKPSMATLLGYEAVYVVNEIFPALKKGDTNQLVKGLLIEVAETDLKNLWVYEGEEDYFLDEVRVTCEGQLRTSYCFLPRNSLRLTNRPWTIEQWYDEHDFEQYLQKVKRWTR